MIEHPGYKTVAPFLHFPFILTQQQQSKTLPIKTKKLPSSFLSFSSLFLSLSYLSSFSPFTPPLLFPPTALLPKNDFRNTPPNNSRPLLRALKAPNPRQHQQCSLPLHIFARLAGPPLPDHRPRHHGPHSPGDFCFLEAAPQRPRLLPL